MSYLREIMQRLTSRRPAAMPDRVQRLHVDDYLSRLQRCSEPMLQYEWAWLEEHIEALDLCRSQPGMAEAAGGAAHVASLLEESRRFRDLLGAEMDRRGVAAAVHRHTLVPTEHSWELTDAAIRARWGIDPQA